MQLALNSLNGGELVRWDFDPSGGFVVRASSRRVNVPVGEDAGSECDKQIVLGAKSKEHPDRLAEEELLDVQICEVRFCESVFELGG